MLRNAHNSLIYTPPLHGKPEIVGKHSPFNVVYSLPAAYLRWGGVVL